MFCIFSKVWDLYVRIRQTGYGRNFFSNLGLNVWRNQPEIANHSNTVVKGRQFSTECTSAFIANVYIISKKIVISYRMFVRPPFFFIRIGTSSVLQHHFTGVRTVSPTAGLDRVPLVSWVRCGTWLYLFLIFAPLLTLKMQFDIFNVIQERLIKFETFCKVVLPDVWPLYTHTFFKEFALNFYLKSVKFLYFLQKTLFCCQIPRRRWGGCGGLWIHEWILLFKRQLSIS